VGPTLHQKYTMEEALAAFEPAGGAEFLCDEQFVVMSKAILCMATVGDPATQTHVASASRVVWKPDRIDDVPLEQRWDAHDKITGVWGPERKRIKQHHVFLRLLGDEKFLYAGKAHLGSYSAAQAAAKAQQHAQIALEAADREHSGFRYHPRLGLVADEHKELPRELARIVCE
jgi:hypothetical protein